MVTLESHTVMVNDTYNTNMYFGNFLNGNGVENDQKPLRIMLSFWGFCEEYLGKKDQTALACINNTFQFFKPVFLASGYNIADEKSL